MQKRYELKKHYYPNGKDHTKLTDYDRQVIKEAWENHDEKRFENNMSELQERIPNR